MEFIHVILSKISLHHLNILLLLGIALVGGTIGGRVFQKLRIPQVVGYIVIGILLGQSGFKIVNKQVIDSLLPVNYFALGLIAFMVGGELKKDVIALYGKQFLYILFSEGLAAFFMVSLLTSIAYYLFSHNPTLSIAVGILLGSIASATDAASTINVLWEYKSKGVLTTTALGIVALDDGLSFLLFAISSSIASVLVGSHKLSLSHAIIHPLWEIFGSIFIGIVAGYILVYFLNKYTEEDKTLTFLLGGVLITLGLSVSLGMDLLLAAMSLGILLTNSLPRRSKEVFSLMEKVAPPIYILFFVMVGAQLKISFFTPLVGVLVVLYLIGRTVGKIAGAYWGTVVSGGDEKVKKYLGWCLFSQASAAIGLSILAAQVFPGDVGGTIVAVITLTTFTVQLIGPSFVKMGIEKAGEIGRNITEDELRDKITIRDVMDTSVPPIRNTAHLPEIIETFRETDHIYYPVVDENNHLTGIISMANVKNALMLAELGDVIVAEDLAEPVHCTVKPDDKLKDVHDLLLRHEFVPVVDDENKLIGIVDYRQAQRHVSSRMMELQSSY